MYTIPFTASRWRLAQSKPRTEPQSWDIKARARARPGPLEGGVEVAAMLNEAI